MKQSFWRSVAVRGLMFVAVLTCCLPGFAQGTLGSLNGTVVDPSGAAVGGAKVTATNAAINVTSTTTASATGYFQIFNLPIGTYTVKVGHDGFDTTEVSGITVQEARATTVSVSKAGAGLRVC